MSSISGLHFGHDNYKWIAHNDDLSRLLAKMFSLIIKTGSGPERWARGLSVMLEKIAGVALVLVNKMRAILLLELEADFNICNKLISGFRMLDLARTRAQEMVPEEIYSGKGRTSEDAIRKTQYCNKFCLSLSLWHKLTRPSATTKLLSSSIASLTLQAFKVTKCAALSMLRPLHNMEFFLRNGFGQSSS